MNKHIKAFTILEVVISLAIMSIIIAMVYVIFTLLSKQLYQYSSQTEEVNNYNQLHTVLTRDFHNAHKFNFNDETLLLSVNNDSIRYLFNDQNLVRSYLNSKDTFLVEVKSFKLLGNNTISNNNHKSLHVIYSVFDQDVSAVYFKRFGVSEQINKTFFEDGH